MYMSSKGVFSFALCLFMSFPLYVLKSRESFTYVSPDVFSVSFKSLIINTLQEIVRVSFSAPNASQQCGAFLFVDRCWRSSGGWEPQPSYAFDNQTLINHWVPNLAITRGVGNHDLRNKLIINHLKTTTCQTYCIVLKIDPADGMDWQAKRLEGKVFTVRLIDSAGQIHLEETGIALIPGVDEYEIVK